MAVPFPSSLQQLINTDSFGLEFGETTIRSQPDVGPAKVRRRSTRPIDKMSGSILLTASQYTTFETFYKTSINGGVTPFTLAHPITGVVSTFRFTKTPSLRPIGPVLFELSMEWEQVP